MGKTLSRLEAHGHITRLRSHPDGRSQQVDITGLGKTNLVQAREFDRNLTPGVEKGIDELRDQLSVVVRWLGSARGGEGTANTVSSATNEALPPPI